MAGSSFPLFRRRIAFPASVELALGELAGLAKAHPARREAIALLSQALPRLYETPVRELPPPLSTDHARAKLTAGIPLLRGERCSLDLPTFRKRWRHVCAALPPQRHDAAQAL